jgi:hypothetical protein
VQNEPNLVELARETSACEERDYDILRRFAAVKNKANFGSRPANGCGCEARFVGRPTANGASRATVARSARSSTRTHATNAVRCHYERAKQSQFARWQRSRWGKPHPTGRPSLQNEPNSDLLRCRPHTDRAKQSQFPAGPAWEGDRGQVCKTKPIPARRAPAGRDPIWGHGQDARGTHGRDAHATNTLRRHYKPGCCAKQSQLGRGRQDR